MYELDRIIEAYKDKLQETIEDIGEYQYQINEKLKNKKNIEIIIELLERKE